jgi:hypothetical protein
MKRIVGIVMLFLLLSNTVFAMDKDEYELIDIANILKDSNLEVDSWEVTMKEYQEPAQLEELLQELRLSHSVTKKENENSIIYLVSDTHNMGNINVKYSVIFPKEKQYKSELVVSIKGSSWSESEYMNLLSSIHDKYFTDDIRIFSCMSARTNDIMKTGYVVENFTKNLKLRHIDTQKDTLNSTRNVEIKYGYTSLWGQKITIQDKPVNVQIVTKSLANGDVQYIIGTPILINEY